MHLELFSNPFYRSFMVTFIIKKREIINVKSARYHCISLKISLSKITCEFQVWNWLQQYQKICYQTEMFLYSFQYRVNGHSILCAVKIKTKDKSWKCPEADKSSSSQKAKLNLMYFARLTWPGPFLAMPLEIICKIYSVLQICYEAINKEYLII